MFQLRTSLYAVVMLLATALASLQGSIVDSGTFTNSQPSGGGFVVATSQFLLTSSDIPNATFDANFAFIDAGVEVIVNGTSLFSTGNDASNFGPLVFQQTAVQPNNIDFSFSPNDNGLPRLNVFADSSGTDFSGAAFTDSTTVVEFLPLFNVANFNSLLQAGNNTIEIVNLNGFQGANLAGDFSVELPAAAVVAVPEPSAACLCLVSGLFWLKRRRRS